MMDNLPPKVEIEGCDFHENDFINGNRRWKISTLIREAINQGCEKFELPLSAIDLLKKPFDVNDIDDFIFHANRVNNVDPSHPIILDWSGGIADGWHRIIKAILDKKRTISAIRLKKYVEPDFIDVIKEK